MNLFDALRLIVYPALSQLPTMMTSPKAVVMLLAIALQESRFLYRRQLGNGPARGFWQFELGTRASKGGVWGVYLHSASRGYLERLCALHGVMFDPAAIWQALEKNDIFACGVARLMLWTAAGNLPEIGESEKGWAYYLNVWRPGKPHPDTWPGFYADAVKAVTNQG